LALPLLLQLSRGQLLSLDRSEELSYDVIDVCKCRHPFIAARFGNMDEPSLPARQLFSGGLCAGWRASGHGLPLLFCFVAGAPPAREGEAEMLDQRPRNRLLIVAVLL
jgi:hypothetical protein